MDPLKVAAPAETKLHFLDYWRIIRIRKTVILAVFLLVVITATLVTFILPEYYSSTARIKIERDQSDIQFSDARMLGGYDPYFIQTEFEVIQSEKILKQVIENLNLNKEWGRKYYGGELLKTTEAVNILKGRMDLRPVPNTSPIEIRVLSEKPEEAKNIANEIATAYTAHRKEERMQLSEGGIKVLLDELTNQDGKITAQQKEVEYWRGKLQIPDAMASENAPSPLMSADTLRKIEGQRIESNGQLVKEQTLLEGLKRLKEEKGANALAQAIPTAAPDTLLSDFLSQLNIAQHRMLAVHKDYGNNQPEVLKVGSQVQDLQTKVANSVEGFMAAFETRVAATKEML